jgi:uracil-DNA glycosylase
MTLSPLGRLVEQIRAEQKLGDEVPGFDPLNGNEKARFLFVLEAPGPQAVKSGKISIDNPDKTAANLGAQLEAAEIKREEIALWNIVPWYIGNKKKTKIRAAVNLDIKEGQKCLIQVIALMPELKCIVLVGGAARRAHVFLSARTQAHILSCHHTSGTVKNTKPEAKEENIAVFKHMLTFHK